MGLDMYLCVKKIHRESGWMEGVKVTYPQELDVFNVEDTDKSVTHIDRYEIAYWRKANAIHNWFVNTCGDGIDECQLIEVSADQLKDLRSKCIKVLANHDVAKEELPTASGFFFGGTEYDEYYFDIIKYTLKIVNNLLKLLCGPTGKEWVVEYQASW